MNSFEVCVKGSGAVGLCLALALARQGLRVAITAPPAVSPSSSAGVGDVRAYALNAASRALLTDLKVWQALPADAVTAVHDISVTGDAAGRADAAAGGGAGAGSSAGSGVGSGAGSSAGSSAGSGVGSAVGSGAGSSAGSGAGSAIGSAIGSGVRSAVAAGARSAGALEFSSWTQGVEALAWIVDAAELESALVQAARFAPQLQWVNDTVDAQLTLWADGKASAAHATSGRHVERRGYGQTALAARLVSDVPHNHTARQWFRSPDVLALLPFDRPVAGKSWALVWSLPTQQAQAMRQLADAQFEALLNDAIGATAGRLRLASPRAAWPLGLASARPLCGQGWALLGDAAHVVHPLAGQGLNLGLADVACLAAVIAAREPWRALGDERLLRRYVRARALPTQAMAHLTDGLLRLFSSPRPLVRGLRNHGMNLLNHLAPIKRALTARALDA